MIEILDLLRAPDAHRVLTTQMLRRDAGFSDMPSATFSRKIAKAIEAKLLTQVRAGVFLNTLAMPPVKPAEAVPFVRTGAIVSLQSVLGDAGVLNNFTPDVLCVMPSYGINTAGGEVISPAARFHFYLLNPAILEAGNIDDRLVADIGYKRATPEKALLDWLALSESRSSNMTAPPAHDIDWSELNEKRLMRLAKAAGMDEPVEQLKAKVEDADNEMRHGMQL